MGTEWVIWEIARFVDETGPASITQPISSSSSDADLRRLADELDSICQLANDNLHDAQAA